MAFFKTKKEKKPAAAKAAKAVEEKKAEKVSSESGANPTLPKGDFLANSTLNYPADVILRPRITEKATDEQQKGVYIFEVRKDATKISVRKTIEKIYKVNPRKINIVKNPAKNLIVRGRKGVKPAVKKAYVYLKDGDKIDIV